MSTFVAPGADASSSGDAVGSVGSPVSSNSSYSSNSSPDPSVVGGAGVAEGRAGVLVTGASAAGSSSSSSPMASLKRAAGLALDVLLAENLSRDYRTVAHRERVHALAGVSLRVADGETVALLGPNGAGKSTLLLILAGVLRASGGRAQVGGLEIPGDEPRLGTRVGFVPQGESLYPELTVRETIRFFGRLHGVRGSILRERGERLLKDMALVERADDRVGALSGGLRQRVAVAASLVHDPPVLLLDEPATGLDPPARARLSVSLRALSGGTRSILFSTHNLEDAAALASRVIFLSRGKVAATMPAGDISRLAETFRRLEAF